MNTSTGCGRESGDYQTTVFELIIVSKISRFSAALCTMRNLNGLDSSYSILNNKTKNKHINGLSRVKAAPSVNLM
jgi:hypothetical protein